MVVLLCEKLSQLLVGNTLCISEMNEPMMIIQAKLFTSNYTNQVVHVFKALL